ncbi:MAG: hypothetical protein R3E31_16870 [Chloroflexota bacterium]
MNGAIEICQVVGIANGGERVEPDGIAGGAAVDGGDEQRTQQVVERRLCRFLAQPGVIVWGDLGELSRFGNVNGRKKMPMLIWRFK